MYFVGRLQYNIDRGLYKNHVFPVKKPKASGHCNFLSSIFELTDPISWDFAKSLDGHAKIAKPDSNFDFNILKQKRSYKHTQFGQMEEIIESFPFKKLGAT